MSVSRSTPGALWLLGLAACGGAEPDDASVRDAASRQDAPSIEDAGPSRLHEVRLTESADPSPSATIQNVTQWNWSHALATDDRGAVHAVWVELATTNVEYAAHFADPVDLGSLPIGRILSRRSLDGGDGWDAVVPITDGARGTDSANVAVLGDEVFVAWRAADAGRLRVHVRRSSDRGATWQPPVTVSDEPAGVGVSPPSLAVSDAGVFVVWSDARLVGSATVEEVRLASSADGGETWSPVRLVSSADGRSSWTPSVAAVGSTVHVAWTDERDDVGECTRDGNPCREEEYYRRSTDGGETWDAEVRLTDDPAESWAPSIAAEGESVHVAYLDRRGGAFRNYHRRSRDGGVTWESEVLLPVDSRFAHAARPSLAVRDGVVHLTWFGFTDFEADVYYATSSDDGARWSGPIDLTSEAPGAARLPHVAVDASGAPHVIWYDTRHSDGTGPRVEIFYGRPRG